MEDESAFGAAYAIVRDLRVRCAWENTAQGLPKMPLAELVKLSVDGREVTPTLVAAKRSNGQLGDHYHLWPMDTGTPGRHAATAVVRVLATGEEVTRSIEFPV